MSNLLYWLGVKGYELAIHLAAPFNPKAAAAVKGRKCLLRKIEASLQSETRPRIWMHCASLGEFEQGRPVLESLREKHPDHAIVVTFFSPSGYNIRKDWSGADYIFYLPFDGPESAARFVKIVRPSLAIFVKYEFWYYLLQSLKKANVPTILIAAIFHTRAPFFQWWGGLYRKMLHCFSHVFVQDEPSQQLLKGIGIENTIVAGDPRYDRVIAAADNAERLPKAEAFTSVGFTIIAGSTWPSDEAILIQAMDVLPQDVRLILAPHEVGESHLQEIEDRFGKRCVRYSQWREGHSARVLLVDSIGLLMNLYQYGRAAYVGGGLDRNGVHNVLEPAAHGIPVMLGPVHEKYREAIQLVASGSGKVVRNAEELESQVNKWMADESLRRQEGHIAREVVENGAGGTAQIMQAIDETGYLS